MPADGQVPMGSSQRLRRPFKNADKDADSRKKPDVNTYETAKAPTPTTSTILRNRCSPNRTGQPGGTITLIGTPPSGFETTEFIYGKIIPPLYGPAPPAFFSLSLSLARMYNDQITK